MLITDYQIHLLDNWGHGLAGGFLTKLASIISLIKHRSNETYDFFSRFVISVLSSTMCPNGVEKLHRERRNRSDRGTSEVWKGFAHQTGAAYNDYWNISLLTKRQQPSRRSTSG